MNKRIRPPQKKHRFIAFFLMKQIQSWTITNPYFLAKGNLTFLFWLYLVLLIADYKKVGLDNV